MALTAIGPVTISHGDPVFSSSSRSTNHHGIRPRTIAGSCSWTAADELEEMVGNPDNQTTMGGYTGVLEWLNFDDALLTSWTGDYLLVDFQRTATQRDSLTTTDCPFTLEVAYIPPSA